MTKYTAFQNLARDGAARRPRAGWAAAGGEVGRPGVLDDRHVQKKKGVGQDEDRTRDLRVMNPTL